MKEIIGLRKFVAPEIVFGSGARLLAGRYAQQFSAKKVLLVSDRGVIEAGWLAETQRSLEEENIPYHIYSDISPNPRTFEVMQGADVYQSENCDVIIAVGGGSSMDAAKGIGIVSTNQKHILQFEGIDHIRIPAPPLIFIPTTAGTSADVSQFAIIANRDELVKIAIISKAIIPDVALIDPQTTLTMDSYLTACTGIDALVHAFEAFVSTGSGPLTDSYAIEAIKLINQNLPRIYKDPNNIELREKVMLGSMKAGLAFSNAILGAVHAMSHGLGGMLDLPHGECNAMLLENVVDFNFSHAVEKYKLIGEAMGVDFRGLGEKDVKKRLMSSISDLKNSVDISNTLAQKGVSSADIPVLAKKAIKDVCFLTNPRKATQRDIEVIYEEAM